MEENNYIFNEGAKLHFDVEGTGPYLLLIPGGGGPRYSALTRELTDKYTVIRYDRRCNSLSSGDPSKSLDFDQQIRDLLAILDTLEVEETLIFSNSGGTNIALKFLELYPQRVTGIIGHEPPALPVLPDAKKWLDFSADVEATYKANGLDAAIEKFDSELFGFVRPKEGGSPATQKNLMYFMEHELNYLCRYTPDYDSLNKSNRPIILVSGEASEDAHYARPAEIMTKSIQKSAFRKMSGHHFSFSTEPELFAEELGSLLLELNNL